MPNNRINRKYSKAIDSAQALLQLSIILPLSAGWMIGILPGAMWTGMCLYIICTGWRFRRLQITFSSPRAITAISMPTKGGKWQLHTALGDTYIGQLLGDSIQLPWILLLHFKVIGQRKQFVMLTKRTIEQAQFKTLQRCLRFDKEKISD